MAMYQLDGAFQGIDELRMNLEQNLLALLKERDAAPNITRYDGSKKTSLSQVGSSRHGPEMIPESCKRIPRALVKPEITPETSDGMLHALVELFPPPTAYEDKQNVFERDPKFRGCTTMMIQNLPSQCTQSLLELQLISKGFAGLYDFLYMPMDSRSRGNRGFGFVNFIATESAKKFYDAFNGCQPFDDPEQLMMPCVVAPADVQGFTENVSRFYNLHQVRKGKRRSKANTPVLHAQGGGNAIHTIDLHKALSTIQHDNISQASSSSSEIGQQASTRFCHYCGSARVSDHNFCPSCGNSFMSFCAEQIECFPL